jgi:FAD/FMN-containing dehydrogenase
MMVIRPRSVQEIVDALALSRGAHRSMRVGDGTLEPPRPRTATPDSECYLDISALSRLGAIDSMSRLVEVELGIRAGRLIDELARAGFSIGEPVGPPSRLLFHYVAETPDLWRSPRAMTLRDRVVSVRGVLPDGAIFATRDSPRAANGPLVDRLLVGGAPRLVPTILTHATLRLEAIPREQKPQRAFRLPSIEHARRLARHLWPETAQAFGVESDSSVVVVLASALPDFPECPVPSFDLPDDVAKHHRRALWRDVVEIPRPFWAYRVDRWGFDAIVGAEAPAAPRQLSGYDRSLLSALNVDGVLASVE